MEPMTIQELADATGATPPGRGDRPGPNHHWGGDRQPASSTLGTSSWPCRGKDRRA